MSDSDTCPVPWHITTAAKAYLTMLCGVILALGAMAWHSNQRNNNTNSSLSAFSMAVIPVSTLFILSVGYTCVAGRDTPQAETQNTCHRVATIATHFFVIFIELCGISLSAVTIYENDHTGQTVLAWLVLTGFFVYRAGWSSVSILRVAGLKLPQRWQNFQLFHRDPAQRHPTTELVVHEVMATATLLKPARRLIDGAWL